MSCRAAEPVGASKITHIAPIVRAHHDQLNVCRILGQIVDGAAVNCHRAQVKIAIASPPASQAVIKVCPYPAISLGCGADVMDVGEPGTPGRHYLQRGTAQTVPLPHRAAIRCCRRTHRLRRRPSPAWKWSPRRAGGSSATGQWARATKVSGRRTDPALGEVFRVRSTRHTTLPPPGTHPSAHGLGGRAVSPPRS